MILATSEFDQACLRRASPSPDGRKVSTGTFQLERDRERERLKNVKIGEEILKKDLPDIKSSAEKENPTKFIKIVIQAKPAEKRDFEMSSSESSSSSTSRSSSSSSLGAEWKEDCLEIEEIPESPTECHPPSLEVDQEDSSWSPSPCQGVSSEPGNVNLQKIEFLQPSTTFLTETGDVRAEEPFDCRQQEEDETPQEYPIQNLRNRAQRQGQLLQPIFKKTFNQRENVSEPNVVEDDPKKPSPIPVGSLSLGPFFSQPFKPVQVRTVIVKPIARCTFTNRSQGPAMAG